MTAAPPREPGIIPARAGFTTRTALWPPTPTDHPRSRGVYVLRGVDGPVRWGSSPLARGLHVWVEEASDEAGIIPARAGFTATSGCTTTRAPDHPRSRGVYPHRDSDCARDCGSSPLARGLRLGGAGHERAGGIIPARAGFTPDRAVAESVREDHPRSRGVYTWQPGTATAGLGSSPLARGLLPVKVGGRVTARIIPARAGFTSARTSLRSWFQDHPRSRGVYISDHTDAWRRPGSSPLARGLHCQQSLVTCRYGIIPARAGFTGGRGGRGRGPRDHPRSRGGYARPPRPR